MTEKSSKWIKHSSKLVHKNNWFKVEVDKVTRPNGTGGEYYTVVSSPASFIVAQDSDGGIYFIGQYRYTNGKYSIEIPAGSADWGDPFEAAKRELKEETGLTAKKWEELGSFYSANGLLREKAHAYLATDLTQTGEHEQEEEGIVKLYKYPIDKILEMIKSGEIEDGQTISSLMLFFNKNGLVKPK